MSNKYKIRDQQQRMAKRAKTNVPDYIAQFGASMRGRASGQKLLVPD